MLGVGNVVSFGGGAVEICAAMGTEVISLGSAAAPAAVTLANGIKPLCEDAFLWPAELHEVARQMTVLQVAHGQNHGVAATLFGSVYTWGTNDSGQLGSTSGLESQPDGDNQFLHVKALAHHKIVSVAAGHAHSVALADDGSVFAWGRNTEGQCGTFFKHGKSKVTLLSKDTKVESALPAELHSLSNIQPFVPKGESVALPTEFLPKFVSGLHGVRIVQVCCGDRFSLMLSDSNDGGQVFSCGEGLAGQLGIGRFCSFNGVPQRVTMPHTLPPAWLGGASLNASVVQIAAGSSHCVVLTASSHILSWGLNCKGQLGLGDTKSRAGPQFVGMEIALLARLVAAGAYHTAVVATEGSLYTWGAALGGRLGHSAELSPSASLLRRNTDAQPHPRSLEHDPSIPMLGPLCQAYKVRASAGDHVTLKDTKGGAAVPPKVYEDVDQGTWKLPLGRCRAYEALQRKSRDYAVIKATKQRADDLAPALVRGMHRSRNLQTEETLRVQVAQAFAKAGIVPENLSSLLTTSSGTDRMAALETLGERPTSELIKQAAAVGLRLKDIPKVRGAPWLRAPLPRDTDGVVTLPTRVRHPALVNRNIGGVSCSNSNTTVFLNAELRSLSPQSVVDVGGSTLTLSGPGLASVCRLAWAQRDNSAAAQEPLCPDSSGYVPIPGAFVRFSALDHHSSQVTHPAETILQAYFPPEWVSDADKDIPGRANDASFFSNDGSLFHTNITKSETRGSMPMLDRIIVFAPSMPVPCQMRAELLVKMPNPPVAAVVADTGMQHSIHFPLGPSSKPPSPHPAHHGVANRLQILAGSCTIHFHALPTVLSADPSLVKAVGDVTTVVSLKGENLFGCALIDAKASRDANLLLQEVQAAVQHREEEEAGLLFSALTSSGGDDTNGKTVPRGHLPSASSRRPLGGAEEGSSKTLSRGDRTPNVPDTSRSSGVEHTLLPTLHMSLGSGSVDSPHSVLVRFDVVEIVGARERCLGTTPSVHGWFTVKYDESLVHVPAAVDRLTGTNVLQGNSKTVYSSIAQSSKTKSRVSGKQETADEDEDEEEEEEGCVGTYSAIIHCALPAVQVPESISGVGTPSATSIHLHQLLQSQAVRMQQVLEARSLSHSLLTLDAEFSAADVTASAASVLEGSKGQVASVLVLRPAISINEGCDYFPADPTASITLFNPAVTAIWPPCGPLDGGITLSIRGSGFLVGCRTFVRLRPLWKTDLPAVVAETVCASSEEIVLTLPRLPSPTTPTTEAATKRSGFCSFKVGVSVDAQHYLEGPNVNYVGFAGNLKDTTALFQPVGGGAARLQLEAQNFTSSDAYVSATAPPADGSGRRPAVSPTSTLRPGDVRRWSSMSSTGESLAVQTCWMPYTARIGHPLFGVTSHLSVCIVDDDTRAVLHECNSWCEMTDNFICVDIPPATTLAADGEFRRLNVSLRLSVFSCVVASRKLKYYDSSLLHVASVGPKKILPGVEVRTCSPTTFESASKNKDFALQLSVVIDGWDSAFGVGFKESSSPAAAPSPAIKGSKPAAISDTPIPTAKFSTDLSFLQPRLRIASGAVSGVVVAKLEGQQLLASLAIAGSTEPLPLGDATVEASIDGGACFTAPFTFKIVKK